ncbi:hypothetical protein ES708_21621 [subsurface metagenome]
MPDTCEIGDSFYITDHRDRHRWVVITRPNKDSKVVIVNFTSVASHKECVVLFQPKDDARLFDRLTTVAYDYAELADITKLAKHRNDGYCCCKPEYVQRIVKGAFQSQFMQLEIITELKEQYPAECAKYYSENI